MKYYIKIKIYSVILSASNKKSITMTVVVIFRIALLFHFLYRLVFSTFFFLLFSFWATPFLCSGEKNCDPGVNISCAFRSAWRLSAYLLFRIRVINLIRGEARLLKRRELEFMIAIGCVRHSNWICCLSQRQREREWLIVSRKSGIEL